jgi:hypothetical protein
MPEPDVTSDAHLLPLTSDLKAIKARLDADPDNVDLNLELADALDRLGDALFNDLDYDDIANSHLIVVSLMRKAALERVRQRPEAERPLLEEAQSRLKQAIARWPNQTFLTQDHDQASAMLTELDTNKK